MPLDDEVSDLSLLTLSVHLSSIQDQAKPEQAFASIMVGVSCERCGEILPKGGAPLMRVGVMHT